MFFCAFAVVSSPVRFLPSLQQRLNGLVPYTGWLGGVVYIVCILAGWTTVWSVLGRKAIPGADLIHTVEVWRRTLIMLSLLDLAVFAASRSIDPNSTSPYIRVSVYQPIFTSLVPLLWWVALGRDLRRLRRGDAAVTANH